MKKVAIGAIMKDEAPYILEWVYYHKSLGFELFVADNGGSDKTSEILSALHETNIIHRIDFRAEKTRPQFSAYRAILRCAKKKSIDIIGFLDCDEFFTRHFPVQSLDPQDGSRYISEEFRNKNATQISYHTLQFGSETDYDDVSLPVLQRFSWHVKFDNHWNNYVKSFIKVGEMFKFSNIFFLGPKVFLANTFADANKCWYIDNKRIFSENYDKEISYETGAILHYKFKTWQEFSRKITRGDATGRRNKNTREYFLHNDLNEICTEIDKKLIEQIRSGKQSLHDTISSQIKEVPDLSLFDSIKIKRLVLGLSSPKNHIFRRFMRYFYYYLRRIDDSLSTFFKSKTLKWADKNPM